MLKSSSKPPTFADVLSELGDVPPARVWCSPEPGSATVEDLADANEIAGAMCELVDGTLVEKGMGWQESIIAAIFIRIIGNFVADTNLGLVSGPDGFLKLSPKQIRSPDVSFVSWESLPEGIPKEAFPMIAPDLAVEVISVSNTDSEMARKRSEYFRAGARLVWMVDPRAKTVAVYKSVDDVEVLSEQDSLNGGSVLPGLAIELSSVFSELDRRPPRSN